jgi:ankyrin repeat protein
MVLLLKYGADPRMNYRDNLSLVRAIEQRNHYIVESLLRYGADTSVKDFSGQTPCGLVLARNENDIVYLFDNFFIEDVKEPKDY